MAAGWPCRGRRSLLGPGSLVSLGRVGSSACRTESFQAECLLWQATPCLWGKESVSWAGHPWWQDPAAGLSWCNTLVGRCLRPEGSASGPAALLRRVLLDASRSSMRLTSGS